MPYTGTGLEHPPDRERPSQGDIRVGRQNSDRGAARQQTDKIRKGKLHKANVF